MSILLIAASPSARSRSGALLAAASERLQHLGLTSQTLRLRELPPAALLHADFEHGGIQQAVQTVAQAQVIVLATPIYKAAYSGLLKVFLDLLPQDGLKGKTIWPLATGGSLAHLLALDYALQPVLSSLGARSPLDPVFATDAQLPRADDGSYQVGDEIARRLSVGAAAVFERLPRTEPALAQ
ncbi:NADPH-dependent FMN reductase [Paucibacter sp. R3-3]|uniref:NADPH-dependent FMN reductase n=1 Tax=Roseateles agri TaxID=3098619 RepID=A0ABU5DQ61_9BURK|nr:NADPH-dependent FMN reductase [Paucibacter sp. R3-3]MDY0748465.1 NADPH-dependent FMN reductase [Paucibacter sp. R3-3]